jgi:hypothetical protein
MWLLGQTCSIEVTLVTRLIIGVSIFSSTSSFINKSLLLFSTGSLMNELQDLFVSTNSYGNKSLSLTRTG